MKTTQADFDLWLAVQYKSRPNWAKDKKFLIVANVDDCINKRAYPKQKTNNSLFNTLSLLRLARSNIRTGANREQKTLGEYMRTLKDCASSPAREIIVKRFLRKMEKASLRA